MAKKKKEKPRREFTRRQRSHWKQQKRRQRLIFGAAILIVVAVLCVVGVGVYQGWYVKDYKPLHETALEVNGTEFDMEYYADMLGYYTYVNDLTLDYASFFTDYTATMIQRNELVKQAAAALGITVSDDEVDELMESTGLDEKYRDIAAFELLVQKLLDEYADEQVPQTADQRYVMAMFLESEAQVAEVTASIEAGESFSDLAAELSLDETTKEAAGDLGWCLSGIIPLTVGSTVLEESAFDLEVGVLSPPVAEADKARLMGYWLIEVVSVDREADPMTAETKVMLLGSEELAEDIIAQLEEGADFAELALEYSQHTTSSGEGGTYTATLDATTTAFDDYVFAEGVELEVVSPPIADTEITVSGGYWLVEVTEISVDRQIEEETRDLLKENALDEWVEGLMADENNDIVNYLDDEKEAWAVSYLTGG